MRNKTAAPKECCAESVDLDTTHAAVFKQKMRHMGNQFEISIICTESRLAEQHFEAASAEIHRIEQLLTTFDDRSQTNKINQMAGKAPVTVDQEVFDLIARANSISELTQGAFDITYGSICKEFWNFDTNMTSLPDPETARRSVGLINYRNVILDFERTTVFLKNEGMRLGFGGIGKGYAAEMAKQVLLKRGVMSGIVNASGDLSGWGRQLDGTAWTIGIADPNTRLAAFSQFELKDMAVATSGNYEKYAVINGKHYGHTIDPKTGMPVSGIKSVTIIAPNAELADALTTPIMVMGIKIGLHLINQMSGIACIIVDDKNRVFTSKNIKIRS